MIYLIILLLSIAGSYFLPWWAAAIFAFLTTLFLGKTSGKSFWAGFLALFTVWVVFALIKSVPNENRLATRVSHLFHLNNWVLLLLVTGLIGGLVGGMAALSGLLVKKAFAKTN